jgi:hypothetical protein
MDDATMIPWVFGEWLRWHKYTSDMEGHAVNFLAFGIVHMNGWMDIMTGSMDATECLS